MLRNERRNPIKEKTLKRYKTDRTNANNGKMVIKKNSINLS